MKGSYLATLGVTSNINYLVQKSFRSFEQATTLTAPKTVAQEKKIANKAFMVFMCNLDSNELYTLIREQCGSMAVTYLHRYAFALENINDFDWKYDDEYFSKKIKAVIPISREFNPKLTLIFEDDSVVTYSSGYDRLFTRMDTPYRSQVRTLNELSIVEKHILELVEYLHC